MNSNDLTDVRNKMVEYQIAGRGVRDEQVLYAMRTVPREAFVTQKLREYAYEDSPLPIGFDQTISQPYIVAYMIEALGLKGGEKVLEIGTGSGYAAAVLSQIAGDVFTIERIQGLVETVRQRLELLNYLNIHVRHGDGTLGWPEQAPFDAIIVAASGPGIPDALKSQLKIGGKLVIPVGSSPDDQKLIRLTRTSESEFKFEDIADVRFVPLVSDNS